MSFRYLEEDRLRYKPPEVKILFVGESPPRTSFFYHKNSNLYYWIKEAFNKAYEWKLGEGERFLENFKKLGCFLTYLFKEPEKKIKDATRSELEEVTEELAREIEELNPKIIVVLVEDVEFYTRRALRKAGKETPIYLISPWGIGSTAEKFVRKLTELMRALKEEGTLEELTTK